MHGGGGGGGGVDGVEVGMSFGEAILLAAIGGTGWLLCIYIDIVGKEIIAAIKEERDKK